MATAVIATPPTIGAIMVRARFVSRSRLRAKNATTAKEAKAISTMIAKVPSWVSQVNSARTGSC